MIVTLIDTRFLSVSDAYKYQVRSSPVNFRWQLLGRKWEENWSEWFLLKVYIVVCYFFLIVFSTVELTSFATREAVLAITFYRYSCKEMCSWQKKIERYFSFVKRVFTNPSILRSIFSDRYTSFVQMLFWFLFCCGLDICISLSPRWCQCPLNPGISSKLDFLLGYNLPRVTTHHNAVNQYSLGATNTDYNLHAPRQISLIHL